MNITQKRRSRLLAPLAIASALAVALVGCAADAGETPDERHAASVRTTGEL